MINIDDSQRVALHGENNSPIAGPDPVMTFQSVPKGFGSAHLRPFQKPLINTGHASLDGPWQAIEFRMRVGGDEYFHTLEYRPLALKVNVCGQRL
jgi:hypothetical protein